MSTIAAQGSVDAIASADRGSAIAETRVLRTILLVFGVSTLVFSLLLSEAVITESGYLQPWWTPVAVAVDFGLPIVLALVSRFLPVRALRWVLAAYAIGFLLVVVSYVPAMTVSPLPIEFSPWPLGITAIGAVAAALVWRPPVAWSYLVLNIVAMVVVRNAAGANADTVLAFQDGFFSLPFSAIFIALAIVTMRNARAIDRASASAQEAAARAAGATARAHEQARLDGIVHDEIMTTLLYASSDMPALRQSVQRQAQRALEQLERIGRDDSAAGVAPLDFVSRLGAVQSFDQSAISFTVEGERSRPVPSSVASALVEATAEAVRNSVRHGKSEGAVLHTSVRVALDASGVGIVIEDDGIGFDPEGVPQQRLGIRVSIRGRLAVLPGTTVGVRSRRGAGTTISLDWRQS